MVIVKLTGGVGNQLFLYAAGRELALRLHTELIFDANYYLYVRNRHYILDQFQIVGRKASIAEVLRRKWFGQLTVFAERHAYAYDPQIEKLRGNIYLEGWWQNPNYFSTHWAQIRKELDFKVKSPLMLSKNSVSIHVRRGDYAGHTDFGVCSPGYYKKAIKKIQEHIKNPVFYVFSDDVSWVKQNLPFIPNPIFVEGQTEIEDLQMMTRCQHHIIANSTFSWWGSVLAVAKKGLTIAPTPWVNNASAKTKALYKKDWIVLKRNEYGNQKN